MKTKDIIEEYNKLRISLDEKNKQRLIMTIVACIDLTEDQYNNISSDMSSESKKHVASLKNFGLYFSDKKSKAGRRQNKISKEDFKVFKTSTASFKYRTLRSTPPIETIVEKCARNDLHDYPFVQSPLDFPGKKKKKIINHLDIEGNDEEKPKIVIFVIGGIGYNEIVALENLEGSGDYIFKLLIGSTDILNGDTYVKHLQGIKSESDVLFGDAANVKLKDVHLDFK